MNNNSYKGISKIAYVLLFAIFHGSGFEIKGL